jgi:hypothetical protein
VHVNRLKRAYNPGIWKAKEKKRCYRKQRPRREEPEEDEPAILAPGPITIYEPQVDNRQQAPGTPRRSPTNSLDTPATEPHTSDAPETQMADPNYIPSDTPRSRRELETTRTHPPVTRLRSRLQALQEEPDERDG